MRTADRTEYIVQALMEAGSMYEDGAKSFLAEHDADRHAELLAQVEQLREAARSAAVIFRSVADRVDRQQQANPAMLRENAASLDKLAGKGTSDGTQPPAGEPTQEGMTGAQLRALLTHGTPPGVTRRTEYALQDADSAPDPVSARNHQEAALVAADSLGSQIVQRTVTTATTPWAKAGEAR
jgi:hypothetical protein